jgi:hypothetical protein
MWLEVHRGECGGRDVLSLRVAAGVRFAAHREPPVVRVAPMRLMITPRSRAAGRQLALMSARCRTPFNHAHVRRNDPLLRRHRPCVASPPSGKGDGLSATLAWLSDPSRRRRHRDITSNWTLAAPKPDRPRDDLAQRHTRRSHGARCE